LIGFKLSTRDMVKGCILALPEVMFFMKHAFAESISDRKFSADPIRRIRNFSTNVGKITSKVSMYFLNFTK
jgi:hypothetical protein